MAKRRGNPNWGKPETAVQVAPTISEFEQVVHTLDFSRNSIHCPNNGLTATVHMDVLYSDPLLRRLALQFLE